IIVASFIPLFFLSGMEGRMLTPLGITFIVALFASTFVALTLTPVLCSYLLANPKNEEKANKEPRLLLWLKRNYEKALSWCLKYKLGILISTGLVLIVTVWVFFGLGRSFLPPFNEGSLTVNVSTLPGVSLDESDRIGQRAEEILLSFPEVITTGRKTGRAELDEHVLGVNDSEIEAPFRLQDRSQEEFFEELRERLKDLQGVSIEIGQPISHRIDAMLSGHQANIAIKLFGTDLNKMFGLGNDIKGLIQDVEGVVDLNVEQQIERPQLQIKPRRTTLAQYGITMPEFSEIVRVLLAGEVASLVYEGNQVFDLTLKVQEDSKSTMERIKELMVDAKGIKVPLEQIAEISSTTGPNTINRENVNRLLVVSANVAGRDLRGVVNDIQDKIGSELELTEGYHIEYGGQFESEQAASQPLMVASIFSILFIFLLLFNEFKSVKQSATILINLPLALIGGVFILFLTGESISIPAIIDFISLFGIATRNGMLLLNRYNDLSNQGYSLEETILEGSKDSLIPILMTSISSDLAIIPLAISGDLPGNEIQRPMAQVLLGGLFTSTLLNGFIVPIVYTYIYRSKEESAATNTDAL